MTPSDIVKRFHEVDRSRYPDVHLMGDDLDVALWILLVATEAFATHALTAAEIADVATVGLRRSISRQRVAAVLSTNRGLVAAVPRSDPIRYLLMKAGEDGVRGHQTDVMMIDPETAFTGLQKLDALLKGLAGTVAVCDPYLDEKTLLALSAVPPSASINLLTLNVSEPAQFRRKFQAYEREFGNVEVRVSATPDLHDRYIIDGSRMWLLGQSLNGIGKKQTFIVKVGTDIRSITEHAFKKRWSSASIWK